MTTLMPAAFIGHGNPMHAVRPDHHPPLLYLAGLSMAASTVGYRGATLTARQ